MGQKNKKIICDIDGVLCENIRVPYPLKEPYLQNIQTINSLYKSFKIILFTSRKNQYKKHTTKWLRMHNVKYHKLIMNKPKCDYYCDDKSITLKQLKELTGG